jgi:hypothetical protein
VSGLNFLGTEQILSDLLAKRMPTVIEDLMIAACAKKISAAGTTPSPRLRARLRHWLKAGAPQDFRYRDARGRPARLASSEIGPREARSLAAKLKRRIARLQLSGIRSAMRAAPKTLRPIYDRAWPQQSRHLARERSGFQRRLHARYAAAFELLDMQLVLTRELGEELNRLARAQRPTGEQAVLADVLSRLHARACQIAHEVAALLRAGYADGAMARWRSLHEVSVVFQFIAEHGPDTAIRYLAHDAIESWKAARGYNAMAARLKHRPFTVAELTAIKNDSDSALAKYGPEFETEYGWAAHALRNGRPSFADLERTVKLDHFRPCYKFASHNVHANPKGVLYRLSVLGDRHLLPTGSTNVGLTDPGQNAALSLGQITAGLVNQVPSLDALCFMAMLNELPREIGVAFWQAEKAIQADERKLRRKRRAQT